MEYKEAMVDLTSISLTLSKILNQSQETMMVISKQIQALQTQAKSKTQTTEIIVLDKNTKETKSKCY